MRQSEGRDWITVELPEEGKAAIEKFAKDNGKSAAELTRDALEQYLKNHNKHVRLAIPKRGRPAKKQSA